ncbi:serine hydrolase [Massilia sp. DJPM01]|uniref:serine hydrolase n=1 Tax=Massilia sp. DJPM01 TaxID=3024404 RepID=UPI00259D5729|nr:serine hydrolase [Massilia sp. DJPM01]MDM5180997.1 serine hydrolase [Massilia sp. DJPM01]
MSFPRTLCFLIVSLAAGMPGASALAAAPASAAADASADSAASKAVLEFMRAEMQERRIPGLQIAVIRHQKVVFSSALGVANIQHGVPVDDRTVFSINSGTKAVTGVAIMQLVEQGKLALAAPVSRYLDGLPAAWQGVTIAQLLNHTSGIPDVLDREGDLLPGGMDGAWKTAQTLPVQFAPGQRFSYNQTNYVLLGKIIDRLSGEPFLASIRHRQFDVVGMPDSSFGDSADVIKNKANSYRFGRDGTLRNVVEEFPPAMRTGAGMNTTATELGKWIVALQQGRLLQPASMAAMWTPSSFADGRPAPWAMGWPAIRRGAQAHRAVAGIGGGRSAFYIYPDDDLAVIILTNLAGAQPDQLIDTVAGLYVPALRATGGGYALYRLREQTARGGFDDIDGQLRQVTRQYAVPNPSEGSLNGWGYRLLSRKQPKPAIAVLGLAARLYPDSANAHDSLAEAYEAVEEQALAIRHYRRSLELDPDNRNAAGHLAALEKK